MSSAFNYKKLPIIKGLLYDIGKYLDSILYRYLHD